MTLTEAFVEQYAPLVKEKEFMYATKEEYSPAKEYLELMTRQGIAAVDTETGDIINAFDPEIPCEQKAEAVAFLLDTLSLQEQAYKDREAKLKEKRERVVLLQDRIKESFKQQMLNEGLTKVKTLENTWYFMNKVKYDYNLDLIPVEKCEVEFKGKIEGEAALSFLQKNPNLKLEIVKKRPGVHYSKDLLDEGLIKESVNQILCKR